MHTVYGCRVWKARCESVFRAANQSTVGPCHSPCVWRGVDCSHDAGLCVTMGIVYLTAVDNLREVVGGSLLWRALLSALPQFVTVTMALECGNHAVSSLWVRVRACSRESTPRRHTQVSARLTYAM